MPRALVLGNGKMLVNFDAGLNMRDLYYPRVGMANHILGHHNSIGVWCDGVFEWIDSSRWNKHLAYEKDTLISDVQATHDGMELALGIKDAVHYRHDLFVKEIVIENRSERDREIRLFFTHDFSIDESDIGDTALYDLASDAVFHYKRDRYFLMSGNTGREGIYEYATGTKRFAGAEGTWRDAEDGRLEGNPIAQGSVDSCISFRLNIDAHSRRTLHYWIAVGRDFEDVRRLHRRVRKEGVPAILDQTRSYWRSWLAKKPRDFKDLDSSIVDLYKRSLLIIRTQIDRGGAITAANDSDILHFNRDHYSYMWPRDGALVAYALDKAGYPELTRSFYQFCARVMAPGGYLWHKYHPDGSVGSSWHPWLSEDGPQLPIQEDETALVLFALWHFFTVEKDLDFIEELFDPMIKPAGDFLSAYRDQKTGLPLESYDLWEERRGVYTFTSATVWAGLQAAARFAELFGEDLLAEKYRRSAEEVKEGILTHLYSEDLGRFVRGIFHEAGQRLIDPTLESSVYGVHAFGLLPANDSRVVATMEQVEEGLTVPTPIGGVARYDRDQYFYRGEYPMVAGNPWIICTLWLADWYIARARTKNDLERPKEILQWVVDQSLSTGVLSEQLHPFTGEQLSVAPLTWSHSTFVLTVLRYLEAMAEIETRASMVHAWHSLE